MPRFLNGAPVASKQQVAPKRRLVAAVLLFLVLPALSGCLEADTQTLSPGSARAPDASESPGVFNPPFVCADPVPESEHDIPDCIRRVGLAYLNHTLGETLVATSAGLNTTRSRYMVNACPFDGGPCQPWENQPMYDLFFDVLFPGTDGESEPVRFHLRPDGTLLKEMGEAGIIPCRSDPARCRFIPESEAVAIARGAGLGPGIRPWETDFYWHATFEKYIWNVKNATTPTHGDLIILHAGTGEVLDTVAWHVVYD